jgi:hypothetical protein
MECRPDGPSRLNSGTAARQTLLFEVGREELGVVLRQTLEKAAETFLSGGGLVR